MRRLPILVLPMAVLLMACGKREKPIEPQITANAGALKFFSSGKMVTTSKTSTGTAPSMLIEGVMSSGATIKLWIRSYTGALDTLQMDSTGASGSFLPPTPAIESPSAYGKLIVTKATPAFEGTFDFVCRDATHVTGDFKVSP